MGASTHIHDDDVAGLEHWHELLLDIGPEALAVDRSIEDARGSKTVEPQGAEEGQRAPVAVRSKAAQAFAAWSPAAQRCHVGLDPGFVDEHQPFRIQTRLPGTPALSSAGNIGASLLKGE
ncbi:TRm2011-2 protein [Mesorhizobium sp. LNJC394B00]|nr:TRm2011-2 protein [Mesorhizobium sp. LNJC394B00]